MFSGSVGSRRVKTHILSLILEVVIFRPFIKSMTRTFRLYFELALLEEIFSGSGDLVVDFFNLAELFCPAIIKIVCFLSLLARLSPGLVINGI